MTEETQQREDRETSFGQRPLRALIVDDEELVREAFCLMVGTFPEVTVVGQASGGDEAVTQAARLLPDLVLMDLRMPGMDGVAASRRLRELQPAPLIIAVTGVTDGRLLAAALALNLDGYILKKATSQELRLAITMARSGRRYLCPEIREALAGSSHESASPREAEVLQLLCDGLRHKGIADALGISVKTVEKHVESLRRKFRAGTTAELTARQRGEER